MNRRKSIKLLLAASSGSFLTRLWGATPPEGSFQQPEAVAKSGQEARASQPEAAVGPVFTWLRLGEVKPSGWIREQMTRDLDHGFAGRLDELCPEASSDIFVSHRNSGAAQNSGNAAKVNWWNGETEGNWRAGFIAMAYLAEDRQMMQKADEYVRHILNSQDEDGYLGVFAPGLRFSSQGELWTQACLMRGLLDYSELTEDQRVRGAVIRATDLSIATYGGRKTRLPLGAGGHGLPHDLMISDVAERLFDLTGDLKYRDFVLGLYEELSVTARDADTSLSSLLDLNSGWENHGPNTYETMRVPLWLWMATGREDLGRAARNALEKLARYTEPGGSAVSQENISNLRPDPLLTEYEYCATKEIQFTLESALQKSGVASLGDRIELLWFNAAQGARLPDGSAITYLTADNRLRCDGRTPDGLRPEPRNKFSPTHRDVAVCCNPNAANVAGLYVRGMWMRHSGGGLAALLYGPCRVATKVHGIPVALEEKTNYPFENRVEIEVRPAREMEFPILLRDPAWSCGTKVTCPGASIRREGAYWIVSKRWLNGDVISLSFEAWIREIPGVNGEIALQHGALLFVQPIEARKTVVRTYPVKGFEDSYYSPVSGADQALALPASSRWRSYGLKYVRKSKGGELLRPFDEPAVVLQGSLRRQSDAAEVTATLVPMGNAPILRRATFPIVP
jgi:DUF1680 family protein